MMFTLSFAKLPFAPTPAPAEDEARLLPDDDLWERERRFLSEARNAFDVLEPRPISRRAAERFRLSGRGSSFKSSVTTVTTLRSFWTSSVEDRG